MDFKQENLVQQIKDTLTSQSYIKIKVYLQVNNDFKAIIIRAFLH